MLTIEEALAKVEVVRGYAARDDDESAHIAEDELHQDALQAIAEGSPDAVRLAQIALMTTTMNFARWCA